MSVNTLKKVVLLGGVLLTADASAFGHIDIHKFRERFAIPSLGAQITACATDPECKPELSDLPPKVIEAARYVTICWDLPHCKNSSIANFTAVCESNSECKKIVGELVEQEIAIFEECMIDHECKTSMKSCWTNRSCRTNFDACMANPADDNPACKKMYEIYPEGFLEKFIE